MTVTESITVVVLQHCPLCGVVLDPNHVLCPECQVDEDAKLADSCAERQQARRPF